jgi:hypothetical protein
MDYDPSNLDPDERMNKFFALISVALAFISLLADLIPICGGGMSLAAIGFGLLGMRSENRGLAKTGIGLSILSLVLAIVYGIFLVIQK